MKPSYSPELKKFVDTKTGRSVIQWTNSAAKDQHFYFTTYSITQDDRWLVFISERDGHPNLYAIARSSGEIYQLTHNQNGLIRSYVYPQGGLKGLSKTSPCLDPINNRVYWTQDDILCSIELDTGNQRVICHLPEHWWTAYNHISPDGKFLCVPVTQPETFPDGIVDQWEQLRSIPKRMVEQGFVTRLYRIEANTGTAEIWAEVPFWVTHVQFDPLGSGRLIFNREGHGEYTTPRIWCLEPNGNYRPLFDHPKNTQCTHENWSPTGEFIVYHGWNSQGPFLAARTWEGDLVHQIPMPNFSLGHVTSTLDSRNFIIDGMDGFVTLAEPIIGQEKNPLNQWLNKLSWLLRRQKVQALWPGMISRLEKQVTALYVSRILNITHLCKHDTDPSLKDQDAHVHAAIAPHGRSIVFTSDREGTCNVYEVIL